MRGETGTVFLLDFILSLVISFGRGVFLDFFTFSVFSFFSDSWKISLLSVC